MSINNPIQRTSGYWVSAILSGKDERADSDNNMADSSINKEEGEKNEES